MKIYQLTQLQLRFVIQNKDLKSKIRRINLKWILLNQLKWILDEPFRVLCKQYKPMQLYLRAGFSSPTQASFFLICAGDSTIENEKKMNEWKNEKMKKISGGIWRCHHFTHLYQKSQSYNVWFLRYKAWQRVFLSFWAIFCSFTPNRLKNQFIKNEKNTWRYHLFTLIYHKWHLFLRHVWFLRYGDIPS